MIEWRAREDKLRTLWSTCSFAGTSISKPHEPSLRRHRFNRCFNSTPSSAAVERFLYRISKSKHAQTVVLKGALLLKTIGISGARPTMDIDMLREGKADQASLVALVKDCATLEVQADGLTFVADSVTAEEITKDSEYQGTRILMDARMDNVRLRIQVDFGVGDVMRPGPRVLEYPVLLDSDTIQLRAYPIESAIAEKLAQQWKAGNGAYLDEIRAPGRTTLNERTDQGGS